jgi:NAD-dependent DNA ligase
VPVQLKRTIEHFGSRDARDIRGLGRQTVDAVVSSGLVKDLPGTVQQIVQQSGRQTAGRDRSGQNRDQEVFGREP